MKSAMKTGTSDTPPQFVRRIVCDHRERPSGVPSALAARPNVQITLQRLRLGDYRVNDALIVERKTLTDFAQSVRDGRLFAQASRLTRVKRARPCLILEGRRINHWSAALPRRAIQGAIITITLVFGLPLLRSSSPEETVNLILYAADQLHRRKVNPPKRYGPPPRERTASRAISFKPSRRLGRSRQNGSSKPSGPPSESHRRRSKLSKPSKESEHQRPPRSTRSSTAPDVRRSRERSEPVR